MPRGHSLSIYAGFSSKKRTSGKRRSLLHPNTAQRPFFSHYDIFLGKLKEKLARKARVYILSEYIGSSSCPWASQNTP